MAVSGEDFTSSTFEEDLDPVQSIEEDVGTEMGKIAPYEGETLTSSDDNIGGFEEDEFDEDGLRVATLEQRFNKTKLASSWYLIRRGYFHQWA